MLAAALLAMIGCATEPLARQRVQRRLDSLDRTARLLVQREQRTGPRLSRDLAWFARELGAPDRWQRMRFRLEQRWHAELRRGGRIGRTTGPWLERQLAGRPERIEPVAIRLFY